MAYLVLIYNTYLLFQSDCLLYNSELNIDNIRYYLSMECKQNRSKIHNHLRLEKHMDIHIIQEI